MTYHITLQASFLSLSHTGTDSIDQKLDKRGQVLQTILQGKYIMGVEFLSFVSHPFSGRCLMAGLIFLPPERGGSESTFSLTVCLTGTQI